MSRLKYNCIQWRMLSNVGKNKIVFTRNECMFYCASLQKLEEWGWMGNVRRRTTNFLLNFRNLHNDIQKISLSIDYYPFSSQAQIQNNLSTKAKFDNVFPFLNYKLGMHTKRKFNGRFWTSSRRKSCQVSARLRESYNVKG